MGSMKTTVELSDDTLEQARRVAAQEGTSLRALLEEGLRRVLAERRGRRAGFHLRRATFRGKGLAPEFAGASWSTVRDAVYREHGA
jgi:hypothetical protein